MKIDKKSIRHIAKGYDPYVQKERNVLIDIVAIIFTLGLFSFLYSCQLLDTADKVYHATKGDEHKDSNAVNVYISEKRNNIKNPKNTYKSNHNPRLIDNCREIVKKNAATGTYYKENICD